MKKILGFIFVTCLLCVNAWAGEYSGLVPGVSTKADAEKELGKPARIFSDANRIDYCVKGHDLKRLSIVYDETSGVIQGIDLFFDINYDRDQLKEWFGLEGKSQRRYDANGNMVEYFQEEGIELHYNGPEITDTINFLRHRDADLKDIKKEEKPIVRKSEGFDNCPADAEKYAKKADPFIEKDQYKEAIPYLQNAAQCDPERVIYGSMLGYAYLQTGRLDEAIEAARKVINRSEDYISYSVLGTAYFRKKDHHSAIPYFEKAVNFPQDMKLIDNLEFLGVCYYNEGRLNEALTTMVKAHKRDKNSPLNVYYLAVISDRLGNQADAKFYYKKYLKLKHNNKDMNFAAKERLSVLNRQPKQKSARSLSGVVGAVLADMKDFNSN